MQKGTTSKGMEANKNFAKWLSCGFQISGTFRLHHVYCNHRVVATLYAVETWLVSGTLIVNTLHKGDNKYNNNNNLSDQQSM
jgi:hypothetical protein